MLKHSLNHEVGDILKTVLILRGLPGCGKTSLATSLSGGVVVSADDYFTDADGTYNFNPTFLAAAHRDCLKEFECFVDAEMPLVIVDNTNTQNWEFESYESYAKERGYAVHHVIVENRHGGASTHDVPSHTVERMRERFEIKLYGGVDKQQ